MNYSGTDYFVEYMFGFQLIPALGSPCNQILYQNAFGCEYHNRFGVSSKKALKSIGRVWVEAASNFCGISTSLIDGSTEDLHRLLERENFHHWFPSIPDELTDLGSVVLFTVPGQVPDELTDSWSVVVFLVPGQVPDKLTDSWSVVVFLVPGQVPDDLTGRGSVVVFVLAGQVPDDLTDCRSVVKISVSVFKSLVYLGRHQKLKLVMTSRNGKFRLIYV
uniref:CSON001822 protein n=1 Tax=Culicoides sonorensis TaxID=179676 RepID=A0A336KBN5_CULSO